MMLYVLLIFSMAGKPVYMLENLTDEECLKASQVVDEKFKGVYYSECIAVGSTTQL